MGAPEIHRVDPFRTADVDSWWEAYAAARRADMHENALIWSLEESRTELQQDSSTTDRRAYLAVHDSEIIGSASLALGLKDNLRSAMISITVPPQFRRRGIGSALLSHLETEALAAGRRVLRAETAWPASAPADGSGQPGREFARRHGYEIALGDFQNRVALPVADSLIDELLDRAPADGYTIRSWAGPVPEELVAEWAALNALLDVEAPMGDLELEAPSSEVADFRAHEQMMDRQRRISFGTVALTPDGRIAAYTQLIHSSDDGNAYQWGTLVRREDRGHRLGLRIKLENLRQLQRHDPGIPCIYTFNAETNEHMLAVNTLLGFAPTGRMAELQKRLRPTTAEEQQPEAL